MIPRTTFGIGVVGSATGNIIDENVVTGNTQGIFVAAGARATPSVKTPSSAILRFRSPTHGQTCGRLDIVNLAPTGETTFERNVCLSAVNAPCPAVTRPQAATVKTIDRRQPESFP